MVEEEGQQFADERREIEQPMELPADERQEQGHQRWPVGRPAHERQPVGRPARESQHVAGPVGRPARPVEQPMESSTDERQEQGLGWPRARDGTSRSWAWDGTRHFSITRARPTGLLRIPGPSHIIQSITRAHPIPTFGFPVPSHPMTGMGPGRDGTSRATDIPSLCFWPVPNPLIG
jgi:hypothetical protein